MALSKEQLEALKSDLRAQGITEGSAAWQREINKAFTAGGYSTSHKTAQQSAQLEKNGQRNREAAARKAKYGTPQQIKNRLGELLSGYDLTSGSMGNALSRLDADKAREIQQILVDNGYDLSFRDRNTGKMRTGQDAIDGRLGNKSINALNQYMALLNGANSTKYEDDYRKAHNGELPVYAKVAGRDDATIRQMTNMYYDYYSRNPEVFAGLAEGNSALGNYSLPYLPDEALSLLSRNYMEGYRTGESDTNPGAQLNLSKMAKAGLLGSRGTELQQQWEAQNVREAEDRGALNTMHLATMPMRVGQMAAGMTANALFGDDPYEKDGLQYTKRYNPITGAVEDVLVPKEGTTVADVAGVDNGLARFAVNAITDPLTLMSLASKVTKVPASKGVIETEIPGSSYSGNMRGTSTWSEAGVPGNPYRAGQSYTGASLGYKPSIIQKGKQAFQTIGNRIRQFAGRKHGGANKVVSTSNPTTYSKSAKGIMQENPSTMPYNAERPYFYNRTEVEWPALYGYKGGLPYVAPPAMNPVKYNIPNFTYQKPGGQYMWTYSSENPQGRDFNVYDEYGDWLYSKPSANTNNTWRSGAQGGNFNAYENDFLSGSYKCGGRIKKRNRK